MCYSKNGRLKKIKLFLVYSPRRRGWSPIPLICLRLNSVFPAQAGMILQISVPYHHLIRIPRAGGDDPGNVTFTNTSVKYSPRKRGWSWSASVSSGISQVFPAQAGMIPFQIMWKMKDCRIPRASGDDPRMSHPDDSRSLHSPRKRGWSYTRVSVCICQYVFPAQAGLFYCFR